jgi:EAL domain-containing protein (putative c-di-GMP-specific phosphodiesterase class I)
MRDADIAMYLAKGAGKRQSILFDATRHRDTVRDLDYRVDLARAVRDREFELRYQPVVHLGSGVVRGAEALVRWRHPARGLIGPSEFIPVAEATGDIVELGRWVVQEACARAARWPRGHDGDALSVSVNVSAVQLADPAFTDTVAAALASAGLPAERLTLEITETAFVALDVSLPVLRRLSTMGVRLAIDDFGTGHASLNQLASLPFDVIKIDRSFVTRLSDHRTAALVETIVALASRLGATAIAEGIESENERARLLGLGCHEGQGFYFSHPLVERDFLTRLTSGGSRVLRPDWRGRPTPTPVRDAA